VSGDGGTSILVNPAGLARRTETRAQFAIALHDDDSTYQTPDAGAENSPIVRDRAQPVSAPSVGLATSLGSVVLGGAVLVAGSLERTLPSPQVGQPPADVERLFPHRYGGLELDFRRRIAVVGALRSNTMRSVRWRSSGMQRMRLRYLMPKRVSETPCFGLLRCETR